MTLFKIDNLNDELRPGPRGILEPDTTRCKAVPIDRIDIAILPGVALDEKGGRIGSGEGYYDRFVPRLPITTRKVALAYECQIVQQVPMESHDKFMDIIITEERIIYKI
jgi:5-formyltetrahydrofolate cyclo-ligase